MITAPAYQGKTIGVFGLARTGIAAVRALTASGAKVLAWDDDASRREQVKAVESDLYGADFTELDALLLAPGIPLTHPKPHPLVDKAHAFGTPLISDIDVFDGARDTLPQHNVVAITGTNGKSTTTALIGHMVDVCGKPVAIGGNIGTGVLSLSALEEGGVYVFELSSFQLDLTSSFSADIAILLNISPDHLDRHGTFENYVNAKICLFEMQKGSSPVAIVGIDDEQGQILAAMLDERVIPISAEETLSSGVFVKNGILFDCLNDTCKRIGDLSGAGNLQGSHNWQNAAAAYAAGRSLGFGAQQIMEAFNSFPGLEHRQETVATIAGVKFVNDSKATNSDAAMRALKSFSKIHWIAGGRSKEISFKHMSSSTSSVKTAYFIGEAAQQFERDLGADLDSRRHDTVEDAIQAAFQNAEPGDTILLSPACAAFDQFQNFEKRGQAFCSVVQALKGDVK